ncbi:amino acid adenylation domain-containing protein [Chloroflexia bacterium SDU3-3]|nr:amino acid adenylation domain-containing protein [Chloroflexia bacterium SDU3-3]
MKILLAQNMFYVPAHGGAVKANRLLMEALAARGHECRAIVTISGGQGRRTVAQFVDELAARGIAADAVEQDAVRFRLMGVEVHAVLQMAQLGQRIAAQGREFQPDVVLVPTDEPGMITLAAALEACPGRVIVLAHTVQHLPFGPRSFLANETGTALLRRTAGIVAASRAIRDEIARGSGMDAAVLPFPAYGTGPFPNLGSFGAGYVTLINPCAYKGLPIFLGLARAMPDVPFAAVPTWGTTQADLDALAELPNVAVLPPADAIDEIFEQTRVLLVPSLWDETFGLVVVEAMLRGIPVLASDVGGLSEAALGVAGLLPVRAIERYQSGVDQKLMPLPVVPEQDLGPWQEALGCLLADQRVYERTSELSRSAAEHFVSSIGVEPFERYFREQVRHAPSVDQPPSAGDQSDLRRRVDGLSPERQALLARMLKQKGGAAPRGPDIPALPRSGEPQLFPCSSGQKRLWLIQQLDPEGVAYNSVIAYRVAGDLDVGLLQRSFDAMICRHESLRTTFVERDGEPMQQVNAPWHMHIRTFDLRALPPALREAEAGRIAREVNSQPYALAEGPLTRAAVFSLAEAEWVVMFGIHHIVSDGWSMGTYQRELCEIYNAYAAGRPLALPPLALQCADISVWQNEQMRSPAMEPHLDYWMRKLAAPLPVLELPTDRPQPAFPTQRGAFQLHMLPPELVDAAQRLSRQEGATPFMTFLAVFKLLLARYTGQEDLVVGTVMANRTHAALEPVIAFLANTLVLRTDLSGQPSFRELLARVRTMASEAYQHQDVLFALLVEKLNPMRDINRQPLFDVTFGFHNVPTQDFRLDGMDVTPWAVPMESSSMPISFDLTMTPNGVQAQIEYSTELFDGATITRLFGHYVTLLEAALADPDRPIADLPMLTAAEQATLRGWAGEAPRLAPLPVHRLFAQQAAERPDAPAVASGDETLSYAALDRQSNQLARLLQRRGVVPGAHVGICLGRSPRLLVAVLAVLKAGGAYVPLDPEQPPERLAFLAQDAGAALVIVERATAGALALASARLLGLDEHAAELAGLPPTALAHSVAPEDAAYIIYTSGSTGAPKGVVVTHGGLANAYQGWEQVFHLRETASAHLQMASATFDVFTGDWVRALCSGARLVLCPRDLLLEPPRLYAYMRRHGIDCAEFVPVVLRELMRHLRDSGQRLDHMRLLLVGSDAWLVREAQELRALCGPETRVVNTYGLTEATIDSTYYEIPPSAEPTERMVPIGRPFPGTQVYVLDAMLRPQPATVPGELYVGGAGLARGYLGRPDLTAERFIASPFGAAPDERLYRTGDMARFLGDGTLELLGRADQQVKLRGYRIELGEIEAALRQHPDVEEAVVLAREDVPGDLRLVAYITAAAPPAWGELRAFLRSRLPEYMMPAACVALAALPVSANGKIDRRALPAPDLTPQDAAETFVAPRSLAEETVAEIWGEVLGREQVGVYDNFFAFGGHSLLATRLIVRLRDAFELDLPLRMVFEMPTPAEQAEAIEGILMAEIGDMDETEAERLAASL